MKTQVLKQVAEMVARGANLTHAANLYGVNEVQLEIYMRVNKILFQNPSMTQPHLPNSGLRGYSIGDIYPYVIVIVGSFVDGFKYHVIGRGWGLDDLVYDTYQEAHDSFVTMV